MGSREAEGDGEGAECENVRFHGHIPFIECDFCWILYRRRIAFVQRKEGLFPAAAKTEGRIGCATDKPIELGRVHTIARFFC
jgi:hypothetical protein